LRQTVYSKHVRVVEPKEGITEVMFFTHLHSLSFLTANVHHEEQDGAKIRPLASVS